MFGPMKGSNPPIELATEEQLESIRVEYRRIKELRDTCMDDLVFEYDSDLRVLEYDYYTAGGKDLSSK